MFDSFAPPLSCAEDARRRARRRAPRILFDYIDGAAGTEGGAQGNLAALERIRLRPRALRNVSGRSLDCAFLGRRYGRPFGIAPMGMCALAWPGADSALAAAARARRIPHALSTFASCSLEDAARAAGDLAWFQLYVGAPPESALAFVDRAEAAGYETLILTVDVPQVARRRRDVRNGFTIPFRIGPRQALDFALHPRWSLATLAAGAPRPRNFDGQGPANRDSGRDAVDWSFLDMLRRRWPGTLIVKGLMDVEDARRAHEAGADALYVSNHGGRQLDAAPPAIEALAAIRAALGPEVPLIFDSGLRSGEDVVKALAMGANFCMFGRALLYGLGAGGAGGLTALLDAIETDLDAVMAQIGVVSISEIDGGVLAAPIC